MERMITKFSRLENEKPGDIRFSSYLEHLYMYQIYHNFRKDQNFYKAGFSRVIVYNSFVFSIFMFCEDRGLKKLLGSGKIKKIMAMDFVWGNLCA